MTGVVLYLMKNKAKSNMELNYVITDTSMPDSFDPLQADKTINLLMMRMLYATPIEISKENILTSNVLDVFKYDDVTKTIIFKVKEKISYSDGSPITARDIALAISRMMYFRPTFPVIKDIKGIEEWKKKELGLKTFPEGLKIDGQIIKITLMKSHLNPLFRFCLELFSIIPETCLDLNNGKMRCKQAPSSGYYILDSINNEQIKFSLRENLLNTAEKINYKKIIFSYKKLVEICDEKIPLNTIVSGAEISLIQIECSKKFESHQIHWTPSARFSSLVFNPKNPPFDKKENRQFFSDQERNIVKANYPDIIAERSLFYQLLPGYVDYEEFNINYSAKSLVSNFKNKKISLIKRNSKSSITQIAVEEIAKKLLMSIEYLDSPSNEYLDKAFISGEMPIDNLSSGFWAQDPTGDLAMFFTPQLHLALTFLWKDENLYKNLKDVEFESNLFSLKDKMEKLNKDLFENSLIAPIAHFRRFFITSSSMSTLNLPQSITSPAPWQLMLFMFSFK